MTGAQCADESVGQLRTPLKILHNIKRGVKPHTMADYKLSLNWVPRPTNLPTLCKKIFTQKNRNS